MNTKTAATNVLYGISDSIAFWKLGPLWQHKRQYLQEYLIPIAICAALDGVRKSLVMGWLWLWGQYAFAGLETATHLTLLLLVQLPLTLRELINIDHGKRHLNQALQLQGPWLDVNALETFHQRYALLVDQLLHNLGQVGLTMVLIKFNPWNPLVFVFGAIVWGSSIYDRLAASQNMHNKLEWLDMHVVYLMGFGLVQSVVVGLCAGYEWLTPWILQSLQPAFVVLLQRGILDKHAEAIPLPLKPWTFLVDTIVPSVFWLLTSLYRR